MGVKVQSKQAKAAGVIGQMQRIWHIRAGGAVGEASSCREGVRFAWIDTHIRARTPRTRH